MAKASSSNIKRGDEKIALLHLDTRIHPSESLLELVGFPAKFSSNFFKLINYK